MNKKQIINNSPPEAKKIAKELSIHGDVRVDNYYWMRLSDEQKNATTPDEHTQMVVSYLEAENLYKDKMLKHTEELQEKLYNEIVGRIKQTDMSVPYRENGYYYITRYEEGKEYPIYSRKEESLENQEEIMLDVNVMAENFEYYHIGNRAVSPDNKVLAFAEDFVSRRIYTIKFKDLKTGTLLPDIIPNTSGSIVWANDNQHVFYSVKDASLRSFKIFRHKLGTSADEDVEVFHETDETYITFVFKTKSKKYLVIGSYSSTSQEYRVLNANHPDEEFKVFQKREKDLEYGIAHYKDKWYIRTNLEAKNFRLMVTPEASTEKMNWKEAIPHRPEILLESMDIFEDYLVLSERIEGITKIRIRPWNGLNDHYIKFGEEAYTAATSINPDFETNVLRVEYTSMTTPNSTFDYDMSNGTLKLLKQQEVVGNFNSNDYRSERLFAISDDGVKVPISLVYHKSTDIDGKAPLLLYGYGSYGNSIDPYFSSVRLSLLDRGFIFAIAHIRGGEEMGRMWYEDGKLMNKKNTFTDFISCGKHLVNEGYAAPDKLFAMGGSAGGLLMGAVINMAPAMWKGVVAAVPFVDVITTMLDESIPLTTGEYDEWGNPNIKEFYDYIKSYSPYDNVEAKEYPALLVTTGYHDSQVQYWEPAKWVAKLREMKTDKNPLLLYTNMGAGHGGASGRFRRFKETAMEYAFLLALAKENDEDFA